MSVKYRFFRGVYDAEYRARVRGKPPVRMTVRQTKNGLDYLVVHGYKCQIHLVPGKKVKGKGNTCHVHWHSWQGEYHTEYLGQYGCGRELSGFMFDYAMMERRRLWQALTNAGLVPEGKSNTLEVCE